MLTSLDDQREWVKGLVETYREIGFLHFYDGLDSRSVARIIRMQAEKEENEDGTCSLATEYFTKREYAKVELLILRQERVALDVSMDDEPAFPGRENYIRVLDELSLISRKFFLPQDSQEHWEENLWARVCFTLDSRKIEFSTQGNALGIDAEFLRYVDSLL